MKNVMLMMSVVVWLAASPGLWAQTCGANACAAGGKAVCAAAGQACKAPGTVTTAALADLLKGDQAVVVLDARTGKYDDGRRLPGAKALAPDASAEVVQAVVGTKDARVVTYCAGGKCPAGAKLAAHLRELGYTNVTEYSEGIAGWTAAGHAVTAAK